MVQHLDRARPPGRNDPCPCGSGKKYKRCCLTHDAPLAPIRHMRDVLQEVEALDAQEDAEGAIHVLEEARAGLHDADLDGMLVKRYMALPPESAEAALRRWWESEHDRFSGAGLATVLVQLDRKDEALEVLADSQGPEAAPEYWRLLATLRDETGDTEAAILAMELYTRLCSDDAAGWLTLADMQLRQGQNDRALMALRRAGDLTPDHILPRMQRLRILSGAGRWREVRDLAEALLEGHYEDTTPDMLHELRDLLARAHFVLGYFDAARRLWEALLQERPDSTEVRFQLASLEASEGRHGRVLRILDSYELTSPPEAAEDGALVLSPAHDPRVLDLRLRSLLALNEFDEAATVALELETLDAETSLGRSALRVIPLVHAARAMYTKEYSWALEQLAGQSDAPAARPPEPYRDLWLTMQLDCLARLGRWVDILAVLRGITQADDTVLARAAIGALAAGKLDIAERLLGSIEDQQSLEARSLSALLGPLRQSRHAAEVRRQQQVDQAEKQRWTQENRELRKRIRELEQHNGALADALALSESTLERLLERVGVTAEDSGANWEAHMQGMAEREHKRALKQELQAAERRLKTMLGHSWDRLSESVQASLREGEWLFAAVEGNDRDFGAALLEYARGLERAYKDAIFVPIRDAWQRRPGAADRLHDEAHDPSLGPFIRFILQGSHLTLGSMAAALDRMGDVRRQGVAISLLRRQLHVDPHDDRTLLDWKRTAERLAAAADARNQPAHAAAVSREAVREFRELVLGANGLLRALHL